MLFGAVLFYQTRPRYYTHKWFRARVLLYTSLTAYGLIPILHWVYLNGGLESPLVQVSKLAYVCFKTENWSSITGNLTYFMANINGCSNSVQYSLTLANWCGIASNNGNADVHINSWKLMIWIKSGFHVPIISATISLSAAEVLSMPISWALQVGYTETFSITMVSKYLKKVWKIRKRFKKNINKKIGFKKSLKNPLIERWCRVERLQSDWITICKLTTRQQIFPHFR